MGEQCPLLKLKTLRLYSLAIHDPLSHILQQELATSLQEKRKAKRPAGSCFYAHRARNCRDLAQGRYYATPLAGVVLVVYYERKGNILWNVRALLEGYHNQKGFQLPQLGLTWI